MPLLMLKNGEANENFGEIVETLLKTRGPEGYPLEEVEIVLVRELTCRARRDLVELVDEINSRAGIGANKAGSLSRFKFHQLRCS